MKRGEENGRNIRGGKVVTHVFASRLEKPPRLSGRVRDTLSRKPSVRSTFSPKERTESSGICLGVPVKVVRTQERREREKAVTRGILGKRERVIRPTTGILKEEGPETIGV